MDAYDNVRRLEAENDALRAQIAWWEEKFPCDGLCSDAPEEDCSRHGRTPADLWERYRAASNAAESQHDPTDGALDLIAENERLRRERDDLMHGTSEFVANTVSRQTAALGAEVEHLRRERDEARKVVAVVDDVRQGAGWTVQIYGVLIAQCDIYGKTEDVRRLEAENDALRATLARVEALVESAESRSPVGVRVHPPSVAIPTADLRRALTDAAPPATDPSEQEAGR